MLGPGTALRGDSPPVGLLGSMWGWGGVGGQEDSDWVFDPLNQVPLVHSWAGWLDDLFQCLSDACFPHPQQQEQRLNTRKHWQELKGD